MEESIKDDLREFEKDFIWFPLRYYSLEYQFVFLSSKIQFTKNGLFYIDEVGISYTISELSEENAFLIYGHVEILEDYIKKELTFTKNK